jgi:phage-related protein
MSTGEAATPTPLFWVGSSRDDLREFPEEVRKVVGFALWQAQMGGKHVDAKVLKGLGGAGVLEVEDHDGSTFRAVYAVRLSGAVYVLHTFQKKSKKGISTPTTDREMIRRRLKTAEEHHAARQAEGDRARDSRGGRRERR